MNGDTPDTAPPRADGGEHEAATRSFAVAPAMSLALLAGVVSAGHIWLNTFGTLSTLRQSALHYAGFALLCAILFPLASPRRRGAYRLILACDIPIGALAAASPLFLIE